MTIRTLTALAVTVTSLALPSVASPAFAAPGERVESQVVIAGGAIPGNNTTPFWQPRTIYTEGAVVSFNDIEYRLTAEGAARYAYWAEDIGYYGQIAWGLAPEQFASVKDNETGGTTQWVSPRFMPGVWEKVGPSTRKGRNLGQFYPGLGLFYNVNDTVTYNGKTYIATRWSKGDVLPTDTSYFKEMLPPSATRNVAREMIASASSEYDGRYVAANAVDGIIGQNGAGEWASKGEPTPTLTLRFPTEQSINEIKLADRVNSTDWVKGGTLYFSDGTSIAVSGIANDSSFSTVTFPTKTVSWVQFKATDAVPANPGLSELEAYLR